MMYFLLKRGLDLFFSMVFFICFSVPLLVIVALIKLTDKGSAVYWSKRIGKNNEIFLMPKFRTMRVDTPQVATHLLTNSDAYITSVGKFLRKTSLDELPQFYSVLVGDMSFVGPRPALFNQYDLMEMRTKVNVHTLVPGITGWAQINGRDEIPLEMKVELDKYYLEHKSIIFDLLILVKTALKVFLQKDISH